MSRKTNPEFYVVGAMQNCGLNWKKREDLYEYACMLEDGRNGGPPEFRSAVKVYGRDSKFCWDAKVAFIAKHKYRVNLSVFSRYLGDTEAFKNNDFVESGVHQMYPRETVLGIEQEAYKVFFEYQRKRYIVWLCVPDGIGGIRVRGKLKICDLQLMVD